MLDINKLRHNNSGVVLVTVIVLTIVLSVVTIGIMSMNISQVSSSHSVVDAVRAEQIALGTFYQYHQAILDGCPAPLCTTPGDCTSCTPPDEVLAQTYSDGSTYNQTFGVSAGSPDPGVSPSPFPCGTGSGPNGTCRIDVAITY